MSCFQGWRGSVAAGAALAGIVLVANIALLIYTTTHFSLTSGIAQLSSSPCGKTRINAINFWSHLGINILSTLLLAASNNCMQCLVSPTRADIDRAHAKRQWLDIGVNSIRNFGYIDTFRRILWVLLAISSIPLHLV